MIGIILLFDYVLKIDKFTYIRSKLFKLNYDGNIIDKYYRNIKI